MNRGEDHSSSRGEQGSIASQRPRNQQRLQKGQENTRRPTRDPSTPEPNTHHQPSPNPQHPPRETTSDSDSENDDPTNTGKENDPSLSPTPVRQLPPTPRPSALGKRPLSVITTSYPEDPDVDMMLVDSDSENEDTTSATTSEQNINANTHARSPVRKSPKLTLSKDGNASFCLREDLQIYEDVPDRTVNDFTRRFSGIGKENCDEVDGKEQLQTGMTASAGVTVPATGQPAMSTPLTPSSLSADASSKVSKKVASGVRKPPSKKPKPKPRIGIRRL